ncbi:hypothetical protein ACIP3A_36935 [Streptomyces tricolor]
MAAAARRARAMVAEGREGPPAAQEEFVGPFSPVVRAFTAAPRPA